MKKWHRIIGGFVAAVLALGFLIFGYVCSIFPPTVFHKDNIEVAETHTLASLERLKQQLETNEELGCKLSDGQLRCWLERTHVITKVGFSSITVSTEIGSCWGTKSVPREHRELVSIIEQHYQIESD